MGKVCKKLSVYLDQNYISEMAKADINEKVNPQFKNVYELLHDGFINEKLTVPASFFHDIETSMAPALKERITRYQGYLGQSNLNLKDWMDTFEFVRAAKLFLGEQSDPIGYNFLFQHDPDERNKFFGIGIDAHLEKWDYKNIRLSTAEKINKIRAEIGTKKIKFNEQYQIELQGSIEHFLKFQTDKVGWIFKQDPVKIKAFAHSKHFAEIPSIDISSKMWAKLLTDFNTRSIKTSDPTDIEIISAYLPYIDVLAVDTFMANVVRNFGFDKNYNTLTFDSSQNGLKQFEKYLAKYLSENNPVNQPVVSIFVLSDEKIKENSFGFFKKLGNQAMGKRDDAYVELYGFNDGHMPKYLYEDGLTLPYSGLQEVHDLKLSTEKKEEILEICREKCQAKKFILIDKYRDLPDDFIDTLIEDCKNDKNQILNYKIYIK